ncbi:TPA: AAA family ATPase [Burkholderia vietnamiensis]|nr:AAA family ATPase [Burkholderia vietnamiensis]
MIGLSGAQRTGKSTLAQAYAEATGVKFVPTSAAATFERLGYSPKADYPFETRLMIQREILRDMDRLYERSGVKFITDRTPIDLLGYTLADVQRNNVPYELAADVDRYTQDCYESANRHFTTLILVQPGIQMVEAEGKAPAHRTHMEHLNYLMLGLLIDDRLQCDHFLIPKRYTSIEKRIEAITYALGKSTERHQAKMDALLDNGLVIH